MRTDPFRDFDRMAAQLFGQNTTSRTTAMPLDAYRREGEFVVAFDVPGVDPGSIDLTVDQNVLTVRAERSSAARDNDEVVLSERPTGTFSRQLFLGETLDSDKLTASYDAGVLTLRIPVAEKAQPRRVEISTGAASDRQVLEGTTVN